MVGAGVQYLRLMLPFYFLAGANNAMQGLFRGVGRLRLTANVTGLQIVWRVIFSHLFAPAWGMTAVCLATGSGWLLMALVEGILLRRYFERELPLLKS